jgi:hypothetical protein
MTFSLSCITDDGGGGCGDNGDDNDEDTADKDDAESRELAARYLHTFLSIQVIVPVGT